ncbi:MAG: response regulator [Acidobacteriota bacterium]
MIATTPLPADASAAARSAGVVLIVDDDAVTRLAFQRILEKRGFTVRTASTGEFGRVQLEHSGELDAAILDYSLPDTNGIELLTWLRIRDPHLAALLVTAMGEKEVVARSLSAGACGYLDKPVRGDDLSSEVSKSVALTRRRRRLARMVEEVQQVGHILQAYHHSIVDQRGPECPLDIGLHYYPHFEVGGDYLAHHRLSENEWLVMSVDVSGHDLSAACTSAIFQGIFSGVLSKGGTAEDVVRLFHSSLLAQQSLAGSEASMISAAVCCLVFSPGFVDVACHGSPQPVFLEPDGTPCRVGAQREPLGWFEEFEWKPERYALPPGSSLLTWTDGLEDLAHHLGIDPLALAHTVAATPAGETASGIGEATDDLMLATVRPRAALPDSAPMPPPRPAILVQRYSKDHADSIDTIQNLWKRTLTWAFPGIPAHVLHDILLCTREAVLNSLRHGCSDGELASLDFVYQPAGDALVVHVRDPGPGHECNWSEALADTGDGLREFSRGLLLIHAVPRAVSSQRNGAHLTMEFDLRSQ